MDKLYGLLYIVGWNYLSIPKLYGCTVEVSEWISDFIPHFIMDVITYSCGDSSLAMLIKGTSGAPLLTWVNFNPSMDK